MKKKKNKKTRKIFIKTADEIIEKAFKKAAKTTEKKGKKSKYVKDELTFVKRDASTKMKIVSEIIRQELQVIEKKFPDFERMPNFYRDTIKSAFNLGDVRKGISSLKGSSKEIRKLEMKYSKSIWQARHKMLIGKLKKEFFGRTASFVKRNRHNLKLLKEVAIFMERMPDIKEMFTVSIAGFPNVGKSTMLGRLTDSKPKIESYQFTTQSIMLGYTKIGYEEVQFADTPGILDKNPGQRNPVEKRAVAAIKNISNVILFVVDASEQCGYPLEEQKKLFKDLKKEFKDKSFFVIINKTDIAREEQLYEAKKMFKEAIVSGEGLKETKEEVLEKLVKEAGLKK